MMSHDRCERVLKNVSLNLLITKSCQHQNTVNYNNIIVAVIYDNRSTCRLMSKMCKYYVIPFKFTLRNLFQIDLLQKRTYSTIKVRSSIIFI